MDAAGYDVEVTGLSPKTTETDLYDFFSFSGSIQRVELVRSGDYACTAYVTFKHAYSQETAVLLSGATILDQRVCITRWGHYVDEFDMWNSPSARVEDEMETTNDRGRSQYVPSAGEAVAMAQGVVKDMVAKGKYTLGKAKAFDESHQVTATAAAKVAELTERIGLADKIFAGMEAVKAVDQKYHVCDVTKLAVSATGRSAAAAANSVVNSSYFSKGAFWLSGALNRAATAAADLGSRGAQQHQ